MMWKHVKEIRRMGMRDNRVNSRTEPGDRVSTPPDANGREKIVCLYT